MRGALRSRGTSELLPSSQARLTAPSTRARAKFPVIRLIPIPSVIVSNGFRSRSPSASTRLYITPRVTLWKSPEPWNREGRGEGKQTAAWEDGAGGRDEEGGPENDERRGGIAETAIQKRWLSRSERLARNTSGADLTVG